MNRTLISLASLALLGCGRAASTASHRPVPAPVPQVHGLLGERERLQLSTEQVAALDSIGAWLGSEARRLDLESGQTDAARSERIGTLDRRATAAVEALLTPAQRTLVCALDVGAGSAAEPRASLAEHAARPAWSWCLPPQPIATG